MTRYVNRASALRLENVISPHRRWVIRAGPRKARFSSDKMGPGNAELMMISYAVQYTLGTFIFEVTESYQMSKPKSTYQSYLLRLWHTAEPSAPWRAMLECITVPGQRHYFKDLEGLTVYLSI